MKTEEVEARAKVYNDAMEVSGSHDQALEAVARAVRAQDAARGGPLTGTQVTLALADVSSRIGPMQAVVLHEHMSAQGRANAALTQEKDILKQGLEMVRAQGQHLSGLVTTLTQERDEAGKVLGQVIALRSVDTGAGETPSGLLEHAAVDAMLSTLRERDEARAELAKAREAFADHIRNAATNIRRLQERALTAESELATLREVLMQAGEALGMSSVTGPMLLDAVRKAAKSESALATLRQRLNASCPLCHGRGEYLPECELCSDSTHDHECPGWRKCEHKAHSLDATPAEHPDTATLRGIRERAKDVEALGMAAGGLSKAMWATAEAHDRVQYRHEGGLVAAYLLGDSGPSGGGETCPMGHPCAGDSPAEVEKSRCPHSDFGDGVCTLPAGHVEPHRLSHDAPEIEDNSDSAFHTRLTASEEATLRMHINRAKAPPNDWSKHAKGCTVEWTPTPSGPTPRVWTCAPDCPSKATTPPSGSSKKPCPNGKCKHPAGDHGVDNPGGTRLALVCCHDCPCGWDTAPGDVIAEGPDFRMTDAGNGYVRQESKPTTPQYGAASEPTPEEDWRAVEQELGHSGWCKCSPCGCGADAALAALARLKSEPRRAAEAMRQRAADCVHAGDVESVRRAILRLPL